MCLLAMRLGVLPSHVEAEGPEVISTLLGLLTGLPVGADDDAWPLEAMQ
jgi:hypothetical protein